MTLGATSKFVWVLVDSGYTIGHFDEQSCLLNNFKNINEWQHSAYHKRTPNPARCLGERCIRFFSGVWAQPPTVLVHSEGLGWAHTACKCSVIHRHADWTFALSTTYRLSLRWDGEVRLPPWEGILEVSGGEGPSQWPGSSPASPPSNTTLYSLSYIASLSTIHLVWHKNIYKASIIKLVLLQ